MRAVARWNGRDVAPDPRLRGSDRTNLNPALGAAESRLGVLTRGDCVAPGQPELEQRPATAGRRCGAGPSVCGDDRGDDGEAEPRPAVAAPAGRVTSPEAPEDRLL